jgi:hypothetical protein
MSLLADTTGQQQSFANYLQQQATGMGGPNPAQAQFDQNINQIAQQQAGAIASQKGISPALAMKMIADQGANAQQNAAGQAATMQAQNQLNSQGLYANQLGTMAGQALNSQGQFLGAQQNTDRVNSGVASQNADATQKTNQGLLGGIAKIATGGFFASGGEVQGSAPQGPDSVQNDTQVIAATPGEVVIPKSIAHDPEKAKKFIQHLNKMDEAKIDNYGKIVKLKAEIAKKHERLKALSQGGLA